MMNDFTKEELAALKRSLTTHDFRYPDLMNKIQSMIDSYCEHEFYVNGYGENFFCHSHKCGEVRRLQRNDNQ